MGIAVLLFDRRGSGASTGKPDVAYQTLADDGIAGANALRQIPAIDPARIASLAEDDLVRLDGERLIATPRGRLLLNALIAALAG